MVPLLVWDISEMKDRHMRKCFLCTFCVKATPTAFGAFIQCLSGSPTDVLIRTGCLGDRMESIGTPERGIRKMTFSLRVLHQEINGSWESTLRTLHSQLLSEWTQLEEKVDLLKEDNRKLQEEQIFLQEFCEKTKRLCEEAHEKIYDLWAKQQQEKGATNATGSWEFFTTPFPREVPRRHTGMDCPDPALAEGERLPTADTEKVS
ncbi:hypothetical protein ACRRTK_024829 [Alexandromys fortis]